MHDFIKPFAWWVSSSLNQNLEFEPCCMHVQRYVPIITGNTLPAYDQFSSRTIFRQWIVMSCYQHIELHMKNNITMHWQKMVLDEN